MLDERKKQIGICDAKIDEVLFSCGAQPINYEKQFKKAQDSIETILERKLQQNSSLMNEARACRKVVEFLQSEFEREGFLGNNRIRRESKNKEIDSLAGKFLFLIEGDEGLGIGRFLDSEDMSNSIAYIQARFQNYMYLIKTKIERTLEIYRKMNLIASEKVITFLVPVEIAKLLITKTGELNRSLIDEVKKQFIAKNDVSLPYQKDLSRTLSAFQRIDELDETLMTITKPLVGNRAADLAIRATLNLDPEILLEDYHARQAAFAIQHWRQGIVGSCFATSFAIHTLSHNLKNVLIDFKDLIATGELLRKTDEQMTSFPGLPRAADVFSRKILKIDKDLNKLSSFHVFLYDLPEITLALQIVGIRSTRESIDRAIKTILKKEPTAKITLRKIFEEIIILEMGTLDSTKLEDALFVLEATNQMPLLRLWENSLASMAKPPDIRIYELQRCLFLSVFCEMRRMKAINALSAVLNKKLIEKVRYLFVPNLSFVTSKSETNSGFVLQVKEKNAKKRLVETPQEFGLFLRNLLDELSVSFEELKISDPESYKEILETIELSLGSTLGIGQINDTMLKIVREFDKNNSNIATLEDWKNLKITPWREREGEWSKKIMETYWEGKASQTTRAVLKEADTTEQQFEDIVSECQKIRSYFTHPDPSLRALLAFKKHACLLMPAHPSLTLGWEEEMTAHDFVSEKMRQGKQLSFQEIPFKLRNALIKRFKKELPDKKLEFEEKIQEIPEKVSVHDFLCRLVRVLEELHDKKRLPDDLKIIDKYFFNLASAKSVLPGLKESIVYFADSNWEQIIPKRQTDVFFGYVVNPRTLELEVRKVTTEGAIGASYELAGQIKVVLPSEEVIRAFEKTDRMWLKKAIELQKESEREERHFLDVLSKMEHTAITISREKFHAFSDTNVEDISIKESEILLRQLKEELKEADQALSDRLEKVLDHISVKCGLM